MTVWKILIYIVLFTILTISIYTDWKKHKIYNSVTYTGMVLGFILNSIAYGSDGFISCCISFIVALLFFLIFYALKLIGAGDVKLILAIATLMNVFYAFAGLIIGSLLAGIYGIYIWIKTKNKRAKIPYGIFIGIGFYIYEIICILTFY